jgi:hypothetical protein
MREKKNLKKFKKRPKYYIHVYIYKERERESWAMMLCIAWIDFMLWIDFSISKSKWSIQTAQNIFRMNM